MATITVKELMEQLASYPDDRKLYFGGLEFYRLKDRGSDVQVEFNQTVYKDKDGKIVIENN